MQATATDVEAAGAAGYADLSAPAVPAPGRSKEVVAVVVPQISDEILIEAARAHVRRLYGPGRHPRLVRVYVDGVAEPLNLPVLPPWQQPEPQTGPRHSIDFRSVNWFGAAYSFTPGQAAVVRLLWEARDNQTPDVGQETLLEAGGSEGSRLADLFREHTAWATLIVPGTSRGTFRLAAPPV